MRRSLSCLILTILLGISYSQGGEPKKISFDQSFAGTISTRVYQDQSQNGQPESSKPSLYIQGSTSGLYSLLTDWKNQNLQTDGSSPSTKSFVFGAECGFVINKYIQVGFGYEYFFTTKVATLQATGDQINSTFFYATVKVELPLESISELSLFIDLDIGSITATEVLENYGGLDFNRAGSTTGYRTMLGAQYFLIDNWSIMAGGGYLFGKVTQVNATGQAIVGHVWPNYSLDLSGFMVKFAVNYHIPL